MQNEIITIFKLLKLIRKGKAPKKIKIDRFILIYNEEENWYYDERKGSLYGYLYARGNFLNSTVEILPEENDEWEDIEEMDTYHRGDKLLIVDKYYGDITGSLVDEVIADRVNQLIKNQKYLKEKLESKND